MKHRKESQNINELMANGAVTGALVPIIVGVKMYIGDGSLFGISYDFISGFVCGLLLIATIALYSSAAVTKQRTS